MIKEYRSIQEIAGPLMLVSGVEGVKYDELGEIELVTGTISSVRFKEVPSGNVTEAFRKLNRYQYVRLKSTFPWQEP